MPVEDLAPLVGRWEVEGDNPFVPSEPLRGEMSFEWMAGGRWLIQRWSSSVAVFPDGLAVLGEAPDGAGLLQHYFDSRGVARVYGTSLEDGVWRLWREGSGDDFSQRFTGRLSPDGGRLEGAWERTEAGEWIHDFDIAYRRAG